MLFRKKPVVIEAMRHQSNHGTNVAAMQAWCPEALWDGNTGAYFISTLEGQMRCDQGDWIIKGVAGEFYPCKNEIFEATYEAVDGR